MAEKIVEQEETLEPLETAEAKKKRKDNSYLVQKRSEDDRWDVKVKGSNRAIKLFKTKAEALEFVKARAEKNDRGFVTRASKGEKKGKFIKS